MTIAADTRDLSRNWVGPPTSPAGTVEFTRELYNRFVSTIVGRYPKKSFGYLVSDGPNNQPTDFVLFRENIRNSAIWRSEFEARGTYFVDHDDAGFVATPEESLRVQRWLSANDLIEVGVFHTHRRHPANFSEVDHALHMSRFESMWHLVASLRTPEQPQLRPFSVTGEGVRELRMQVGPDVVVEPNVRPAIQIWSP